MTYLVTQQKFATDIALEDHGKDPENRGFPLFTVTFWKVVEGSASQTELSVQTTWQGDLAGK